MGHPNHFPAFEKTETRPENSNPLKARVQRLSGAFGPAGSEEVVRGLLRDEIKGYADEVRTDALGNLIAKKRGTGSAPRSKLMLAAHMDEVGLVATRIDSEGYIRFSLLGPLEPLALVGERCVFAGGTVGVIGRERKSKGNEIEVEQLFIDVGAGSRPDVRVNVGDTAVLLRDMNDLGNRLVGKAFDDRIGCAILVETMRQLKKSPNDVFFVFTAQGHVGARGAATSVFGLEPDLAVAIDVGEACDTPEAEGQELALGKGPAIKVKDAGILVSPSIRNLLVAAAAEARVPYQFEVKRKTGGDAGALQLSREGVHAGALTIPLRHLHTASEMVDLDDITNGIKLVLMLLSKPLALAKL